MRAMLFRFVEGPDEARTRTYYYMMHSALVHFYMFALSFLLPLLSEARYVCLAMGLYGSVVVLAGVGRYPVSLLGSGIGDVAYFYAIGDFLTSYMLAAGVEAAPVAVTCAVLALGAIWRLVAAANLYVQVKGSYGIEV